MNRKDMTIKIYKVIRFLIISTSIFFFLAGSAYCQEEEKKEAPRLSREAQLAMVEAQKFFDNEEWGNARQPLLDYLATNPEVVVDQVYLMLGYCWFADDKIKEASNVFKEGHEKYPDNYDLLSYYANSLYMLENFAEAAPLLESLYEKSPKKEERFLEAAYSSYYQINKISEVIRILKRLISMNEQPKDSWFETMLLIYYNDLEDYDKAEETIHTALKYYPVNPKYWELLSVVRQQKEDFFGMVAAYEIYRNVKPPEKERDWNQLISFYHNFSMPLREIKAVKKQIKGDTTKIDRHILVADSLSRVTKIDEAVKYLDSIIKKNKSTKLMLKKTEILYYARKNKEAITACDDLIAVNPDEGGGKAYFMKGNAAWDMEDWDLMEKAFKRAQSYKEYKQFAKYALDIIGNLDEAKEGARKK